MFNQSIKQASKQTSKQAIRQQASNQTTNKQTSKLTSKQSINQSIIHFNKIINRFIPFIHLLFPSSISSFIQLSVQAEDIVKLTNLIQLSTIHCRSLGSTTPSTSRNVCLLYQPPAGNHSCLQPQISNPSLQNHYNTW